MTPDELLSHFERVKPCGPDAWVCACPNPTHKRNKRRLAIAVKDGVILLHCFACMDTPAIMRSVGLELADLYPERIKNFSPESRHQARLAFKRASWEAALRVLDRESRVIECAARSGVSTDADRDRFRLARRRIDDARHVLAEGWRSHTDDAAMRDLKRIARAA